jgi:hypothetical protein
VFSRFLCKRPRLKIEGGIETSLNKVSLNLQGSNHLQPSKLGKMHGSKIIEADGYVDNSPLRSELTTFPQPQPPGEKKEENAAKAISTWVIHKQLPADLYLRNPPCNCVWITPQNNDRNWSKGGSVSDEEPLTQSCHSVISVKEEIG